jgi:hypothetical protein
LTDRELAYGKLRGKSYNPNAEGIEARTIDQGTWLLAMRILDDKLWAQGKNGELTALSIGGSAVRNPA